MIWQFIGWSLTQAAVGLFFVWLFKEAITAAMMKSAQRDLERQKHELSRLSETLKFELQREMLKAELSTAKIHEIYPRLTELLRQAEGAVAALFGVRRSPDFKLLSDDELDLHLEQKGFSPPSRAKLITAITMERDSGLKALDQALANQEIFNTRKQVIEAHNYAIVKSLYISPRIRKLAFDITTPLHNLIVDVELKTTPNDFRAQLNVVSMLLDEMEERMRSEINPRIPVGSHEGESPHHTTSSSSPGVAKGGSEEVA